MNWRFVAPTPELAFATGLFSLVYFGIAVVGFGGISAFFSLPPLVALTSIGLVQLGAGLSVVEI